MAVFESENQLEHSASRPKDSGRIRRLLTSASVLAAACATLQSFAAHAETPAPQQIAANEGSNPIGEIVVTARRRVERLQDVPVAVSAISGADLAKAGLNQVQQLQFTAPSTNISIANPRQTNFAIRGLGNNPATDGLASSVGIYIDGVYLDRPGMADFNLLDIDRVEVLRGPQGTLFGKNTTAGAISITTRAPSQTFEAEAQADFGNYNLTSFQGSVSGPINDQVSVRLSGYKTDRAGYLRDIATGGNNDSLHREGVRAQLLYRPNDAFSLRLIGEYGGEDDSGGAEVLYNKGPLSSPSPRYIPFDTWAARLGVNPVNNPRGLVDDLNEAERLKQTERAGTALADYKLGDFTLSSVTGYRAWTFTPFNDFDWGPSNAFTTNGVIDREKQYSEEIRLTSPAGHLIDYVVGLYAFHRDLDAIQKTVYGPQYSVGLGAAGNPALNGATSLTLANPSTSSYAVFGQATVHFDPKLSLTLGVRETYERSTEDIDRLALTGGTGAPPVTVAPYSGSVAVSNTSPSGLVDLSYKITPDAMAYVSAAYGAKAGGFNSPAVPQSTTGAIQSVSTLIVKPERSADYEAGLKTAWFGRRLTVNVDVYWTTIWDYQANSLLVTPNGSNLSVITNVGSAVSRGFEAEWNWQATTGLSLNGSVGYNDAYYSSFRDAPAVQGALAGTQDLTNRPMVEAPKWTANIGGAYSRPIAPGITGYVNAQVAYHSGYYGYIDDSSYSALPGYIVGNLRVGATFQEGRYDVSLWVHNIGDARYYNSVTPAITGSGGYFASVADPRMFGATLKASF
jgi:iron complex outermembrane receptor protein